MGKEVISEKQGISMMVLFLVGSTMVLGAGGELNQDVWIAIILAMTMAVPILFVYGRITKLYPGKNLYDVLVILYGNIFGRIVSIIYIWYSIHLGGLVIRNFSEFLQTVSIPETPQPIMIMLIGILSIYIVKSGVEVMGRFGNFIAPIVISMSIILTILSMRDVDFNNLKPLFYSGFKPILKGSATMFAFPFAEVVMFLPVFGSLDKKANVYKVYYISLIIGGFIMIIASIRNYLTLGSELTSILYFSAYSSIGLIDIGDFLQRLEVLISIIYLMSGLIKISICLYSASVGISKLFNFKDYRKIVSPVALISMNLACIIYSSIMEMFVWALKIYKYYAIPFQVIIPIFILITAEIKTRANKNKSLSA